MRLQNIRIIRVNQNVLHAFLKEVFRVAHKILVKRVIQPNEETQGFFFAAAAPSGLLPGAGNAPRVAGKNRCIQPADVNTKFQRGGRHHAQKLPPKKFTLYFAPVFRQITRTIGLYFPRQHGAFFLKTPTRIDINQLSQPTRSGEGQSTDFIAHQCGKQVGCLAVGAASHALCFVNKGRIPENKTFTTPGRAIFIHHIKRHAHQPLRMLARIGNGCRTADELRI